MNLIKIVPAHKQREHRMAIRRMAGSAVPPDPIIRALEEIAVVAIGFTIMAVTAAMFVGWWVM